ncbi:MAG: MgtC/SapB family protein, partial [Candidatus Binatia bacterium]
MNEWLTVDANAPITVLGVLARMLLACVLGAAVGWEREVAGKEAGLRTHILVSLGAAVFTLAALELFQLSASEGSTRGDPTRIVEGIAQGIGFLGAGQILKSGGSVQGVTTAAGIWLVGAIGMSCGAGYYLLATLGVVFAVVVLGVVR